MRRFILSAVAGCALLTFSGTLAAQTYPYDHIHVNVPDAATAANWYEKYFGGKRITESPNRLMFGSTRFVAGAEVTRHDRGGAVGQEVEDTEGGGEHCTGDPEPAELMRTEMPDDRRIGEDVQGFGDQRAECRHCEPQNLPIPRIHPHRETLGEPKADARRRTRRRAQAKPEQARRSPERKAAGVSPAVARATKSYGRQNVLRARAHF
jgi:catechol 2,3-dioxygenase-like lactoylglutathione lyase family enzyme